MDQPISTPSPPRPPFPWRHVVVSAITTATVLIVGTFYFGAFQWRENRWYTRSEPDGRNNSWTIRGQNIPSEQAKGPTTAGQAKGIVEQFLDLTLPPEPINYTLAATLLSEPLASELRTDIGSIPRWYGIQDGPDHTRVLGVGARYDTANVLAGAYYGDIAGRTYNADRLWEFEVQFFESQGWRITSIKARE